MTWMIVGYAVMGLLVARKVRINTVRKVQRIQHARANGGHRHVDEGYVSYCKEGFHWCEQTFGRRATTFLGLLLWPLPVAYWITARGIPAIFMGSYRASSTTGKILAAAPPVKALVALNHWYWEDPHDRKKALQ